MLPCCNPMEAFMLKIVFEKQMYIPTFCTKLTQGNFLTKTAPCFCHQNNVPMLVNKVSSKTRYILFLMALLVGIHTMCLLVTKVSPKSYNACLLVTKK